jgi:hypothetical protein
MPEAPDRSKAKYARLRRFIQAAEDGPQRQNALRALAKLEGQYPGLRWEYGQGASEPPPRAETRAAPAQTPWQELLQHGLSFVLDTYDKRAGRAAQLRQERVQTFLSYTSWGFNEEDGEVYLCFSPEAATAWPLLTKKERQLFFRAVAAYLDEIT